MLKLQCILGHAVLNWAERLILLAGWLVNGSPLIGKVKVFKGFKIISNQEGYPEKGGELGLAKGFKIISNQEGYPEKGGELGLAKGPVRGP